MYSTAFKWKDKKKKTKPLAFMLFMFCCFFYAPYVLPMKSPRLGLLVLLLL